MRVFVGIPLPSEVRKSIFEFVEGISGSISGIKWVEKDNYHITLKFIGETGEEEVESLSLRLKEASRALEPFSIRICGFGAFPALAAPRVLWVGIGEGAEMVRNLHRLVEDAASTCGFSPETKRFHPHVTIGRVKKYGKTKSVLRVDEEISFGRVDVDGFCVFRSTLTRQGPIYDIIDFVELGRAGRKT